MRFNDFRAYRPKDHSNVFVLICEDEFLVEESRAVWAGIFGGNWVFEKLSSREFEAIEFSRLMDEALTPSLFSQSRALLITQPGRTLKGRAEDLQVLRDVARSSLKVILVCDSPKSAEGWTSAFPTVTIDPLKPADVARWLIDRYGVSADLARYIVDASGTDLYTLHNEMEKLKTFVGERPMDIRDVDASILRIEAFGPWELDDAILARDYRKSVTVVGAMLDQGTEPLMILGKIVRVWRQLFVGKGLVGKGSAGDVAVAAGVPAFKAASFAGSCRAFGWKQLVGGFRELLQADRAFKMSPPNIEAYFDVLLWKLVS